MMQSEGLIKDRTEAILKDLQTLISVCYILMVGIGMLFEYQKYSLFGVNIFDYAHVFDFLLAPFNSPLIFIFIVLSLLVSYIAFKSDLYMKRKWPKIYKFTSFGFSDKSWYSVFRIVASMVVFILYIFISSTILAENFKNDFLISTKTIRITFANDDYLDGKQIGATNEVLSFYDNKNSVQIIPITSLVKAIDLNFDPFIIDGIK